MEGNIDIIEKWLGDCSVGKDRDIIHEDLGSIFRTHAKKKSTMLVCPCNQCQDYRLQM